VHRAVRGRRRGRIHHTFPVAAEVDAVLLDRLTPEERGHLQRLLAKLTATP
jgi:hypothetical protein